MLTELHVRNLGVIEELTLDIGPGMTVLTGETGAGKTLVIEALELLVGGRADPVLVRPGAASALVEGRFEPPAGGHGLSGARRAPAGPGPSAGDDIGDSSEVLLAREVPASGRSRAWINRRMATATNLSETGSGLIDLHGQHDHQNLLGTEGQRRALDSFGLVDLAPLAQARSALSGIEAEMSALGGDPAELSREADFLRFQIDELEKASIGDPTEERALADDEEVLAEADAHRSAASEALTCLNSDDDSGDISPSGARHSIARAISSLTGRTALTGFEERLRSVAADIEDLAGDLRGAVETFHEDPERLARVRSRRQLLVTLARKYGGTLDDARSYLGRARRRLAEIEGHDTASELLERRREIALEAVRAAQESVRSARTSAAPRLAVAVEERLRLLAMPHARIEVHVGESGAGDQVVFLLGANLGEPAMPLSKVASGGELARTMLAVRLVTTGGPPTLVFDEVDAGIGGEAAVAVGRALAELAATHQIVVVTHLPQVAAFADRQVAVAKVHRSGRTYTEITPVEGADRVVELSRMLSGQPESSTAREHAEELLAVAARQRGGRVPHRSLRRTL